MRRAEPVTFQRNAIEMAAAGVILARHEHDTPHLGYVRFVARIGPDDDLRIDTHVQTCPGADCPDGRAGIFVPATAQGAFERAHPDYWRQDLAAVATAFIQEEIAKGAVDVGLPIDVVRVAGGRISWICRKPGCVESE